MRTDFIERDMIGHVVAALTPANQLVARIALETGLRVGDVVALKTDDLKKGSFTIREQKTGKKRRVRLPDALRRRVLAQAGVVYAFPHRLDEGKHRTRQAVYSDIKRAAKLFRIRANLAPHSLRKIYAVDLYRKSGSIEKVREALNQSNDAVAMIYALADMIEGIPP